VKSLNEQCKRYGLRAKPTTLVELPFGTCYYSLCFLVFIQYLLVLVVFLVQMGTVHWFPVCQLLLWLLDW
jgi:hypothetical protein